MPLLSKGRYSARATRDADDIHAAQSLRALAFHGPDAAPDSDRFDAACTHILIEEREGARLVGCCRILPLAGGHEIEQSYAAQAYDLSALQGFPGKMVELGRFCTHPELADPDILRVAWGALTAFVDAEGIEMLFGCASFHGTDATPYADSLAVLRARHLGPEQWLPRVKAPQVVPFAQTLRQHRPDLKRAMLRMPPLLRTYLLMGGWVSDHAVIDPQMNTLHVFTALEIGAIPPARKRLLRAVAQGDTPETIPT